MAGALRGSVFLRACPNAAIVAAMSVWVAGFFITAWVALVVKRGLRSPPRRSPPGDV